MNEHFADTTDYHIVDRNGKPFELQILRDTEKPIRKKIRSRPGLSFCIGDYIKWNHQYWIVTSLDPDEKTCPSGSMHLCTFLLRWQDTSGKIIERWCYLNDSANYSSGVQENNSISYGDNQYEVTIPSDIETQKLYRDMRFPIDFEDADEPDIYKLTNKKVLLNDNQYFDRGGLITLTLSSDSFNKDKDKLISANHNTSFWICDYVSPAITNIPADNLTIYSAINGNRNLNVGYPRTYTVSFSNAIGEELADVDFEWRIESDFNADIHSNIMGKTIHIQVNDKSFINRSFLLQVIAKGSVSSELKININKLSY